MGVQYSCGLSTLSDKMYTNHLKLQSVINMTIHTHGTLWEAVESYSRNIPDGHLVMCMHAWLKLRTSDCSEQQLVYHTWKYADCVNGHVRYLLWTHDSEKQGKMSSLISPFHHCWSGFRSTCGIGNHNTWGLLMISIYTCISPHAEWDWCTRRQLYQNQGKGRGMVSYSRNHLCVHIHVRTLKV